MMIKVGYRPCATVLIKGSNNEVGQKTYRYLVTHRTYYEVEVEHSTSRPGNVEEIEQLS